MAVLTDKADTQCVSGESYSLIEINSDHHQLALFALNFSSGEMIVMNARSEVTDDDEVSPHYWIPSTFASGLMVLYTLVHAILYIDGAWQSCRQYRLELIKYMHATGPLVNAVQGRISCNAVFDFM